MYLLHSVPYSGIYVLIILVIGILIPIFIAYSSGVKNLEKNNDIRGLLLWSIVYYILLFGIFNTIIMSIFGFVNFIASLGDINLISHSEFLYFYVDWILVPVLLGAILMIYLIKRKFRGISFEEVAAVPSSSVKIKIYIFAPVALLILLMITPTSFAFYTSSLFNSPLICTKITSKIDEGRCIQRVAVNNENVEACKYIETTNYSEEIIDYKNDNKISYVSGTLSASNCVNLVSTETGDKSKCEELKEISLGQSSETINFINTQYGKCIISTSGQIDKYACDDLFSQGSHTGEIYACINEENINRQDKDGNTILMIYLLDTDAGYYDHWTEPNNSLYPKIFSHNPDVNIANNKGQTALHIWLEEFLNNTVGKTEVLDEILKAGADTYAVDNYGNTPDSIIDRGSPGWSNFGDDLPEKLLKYR